ncbi:hypothetical protein BDBG_16243 [Blastomyces gilchristii SLH14081]|uniref:Uncharacterized protein n=1 Tax=Blastomyces gilchristii (strain SLH14081) TaxID=559298 RepID=A0A179UCZ9_BLAGS|nr:uncharacterized protein BDBG_16243 [Blastomyces gilchristii SLH14081]OAT04392.1 hypothetical protein BDBG_16243 [Blastomyces gilchristii SLH14081]
MTVKRAGNRSDTDTSVSRRDDTLLQDTVTTVTAVREVEEDMTMKAVLLQLIDIITFNLAFLVIMKAAATSQRHLLTRKHQNKSLIISQE